MCGAPLTGRKRWLPSPFEIPWADVILFLLLATLLWLWFASPFKFPRKVLEAEVVYLTTPTATSTSTPTPTPTFTPTPYQSPTPTLTPTPSFITHTVQEGEGLLAIALKYGTTVEEIMKANKLDSSEVVWEGDVLVIPVPAPTATPTPTSGVVTYTVKAGEGLLDVAARFEVPVQALMDANAIPEPRLLKEGEVLVIPQVTPSPTPAAPQPSATPTEEPMYRRPELLSPPDGTVYEGEDAVILLSWVAVKTLGEDEWYVVRLRYRDRKDEDWADELNFWTKATSWHLPSYLHPPSEAAPRLFKWDVTVVRRAAGPSGQIEMEARSPISHPRQFYWY